MVIRTMVRFSFRRINTLFLLAVLSLSGATGAISFADERELRVSELRVVVEYDSTGHRLLRVVELPSSQSAPVSDHLYGKAKAAINPNDAISKVKLLWFSADGALINSALMNDPRLTHAPLSGGEQSPSVVGLKAGAFMVSGPSESAILEVHMPANMTLGLDQQVWRMNLVQ